MNDEFTRLAFDIVSHAAKLCAVVEWCIKHKGECLADNPHQLGYASKVLKEARARMEGKAP